jgi:hypothetical protein
MQYILLIYVYDIYLIGELSQLAGSVKSSGGGTASISIGSSGSAARDVQATEVTYNSATNEKCWFIKDADVAALKINFSQFMI